MLGKLNQLELGAEPGHQLFSLELAAFLVGFHCQKYQIFILRSFVRGKRVQSFGQHLDIFPKVGDNEPIIYLLPAVELLFVLDILN